MSDFVAVAEKLRVAGRALREGALITAPMGAAPHVAWHEIIDREANIVDSFWGELAGHAGPEYRCWVVNGARPTPPTILGEIGYLAMQLTIPEWEALAADREFVYRDQAAVILQLRRIIDGKAVQA